MSKCHIRTYFILISVLVVLCTSCLDPTPLGRLNENDPLYEEGSDTNGNDPVVDTLEAYAAPGNGIVYIGWVLPTTRETTDITICQTGSETCLDLPDDIYGSTIPTYYLYEEGLDIGTTYNLTVQATYEGGDTSDIIPLQVTPFSAEWTSSAMTDDIKAAVALSPNGEVVYVGCVDGYLYALQESDGTPLWSFNAGDGYEINQVPTVMSDGTILVVSAEMGVLYAVDTNGQELWYSSFAPSHRVSSPALSPDESRAYYTWKGTPPDFPHMLCAVSTATGNEVWAVDITDTPYGNPAVAADGTIYVIAGDSLKAYNPNNSEKWTFSTEGGSFDEGYINKRPSPAIGSDGTVYFGCGDQIIPDKGHLYAVNPNGTEKWFYEATGGEVGEVVIDAEGNLIAVAGVRTVFSVDNQGTERWVFTIDEDFQIKSLLAVDADGIVHFGVYEGYMFAVDSGGQLNYLYKTTNSVYATPVITASGHVIFGHYLDEVASVYNHSTGGLDSPWSSIQGNPQHTGLQRTD